MARMQRMQDLLQTPPSLYSELLNGLVLCLMGAIVSPSIFFALIWGDSSLFDLLTARLWLLTICSKKIRVRKGRCLQWEANVELHRVPVPLSPCQTPHHSHLGRLSDLLLEK